MHASNVRDRALQRAHTDGESTRREQPLLDDRIALGWSRVQGARLLPADARPSAAAGDEIDRRSDGGASSFGVAFAKAQLSVGQRLPERGTAFVSVNNHDKANLAPIARDLAALGFHLIATRGTAASLRAYGLEVDVVFKANEGRPNIADEIVNRKVDLIVNTLSSHPWPSSPPTSSAVPSLMTQCDSIQRCGPTASVKLRSREALPGSTSCPQFFLSREI